MSPPREDNYQAAEVSNVTAAPNTATSDAVNRIVINTLDELLSTDDTRTTAQYLTVAFVIFLLLFSSAGAFYGALTESVNVIDQSRLN